jgi:hypothetical protein
MQITNSKELREAVRQGNWAWPGAYPLFFTCADGECLHPETVRRNYKLVLRAVKYPSRTDDQWRVVALDINWKDTDLYDADNGKKIESAYGES